MEISIIAAIGNDRQLGLEGKIPWHLRSDMLHFKELTTGHTIIMGRITHDGMGTLKKRKNIIVSNNTEYQVPDCLIAHSLPSALQMAQPDSEAFIIGGAEIYAQAFPLAVKLYLTVVNYDGPADVFFPEFDYANWLITKVETPPKTEKDDYDFEFLTYERIKPLTP